MVFSSVTFLFLFLPAVFLMYFVVPKKFRAARNLILLFFSLGFYAWGEPKYIVLMLISIAVNYIGGFAVSFFKDKNDAMAKASLIISVILNLGLLAYYKYFTFFAQSFLDVFGIDTTVANILLPIGISFYTFQGLSYVIDVYRNNAPLQKNPLNIALYVSLFPQLIAGPIVRYSTVASEINTRNETLDDFAVGVRRFMFGFAKKMLLANTMGAVADEIFATADISTLTFDLAWLGAITFYFQIYFDFSGYSDMAIGLGRMFGFHFLENFNYPLISKSATEFWRRWHMSLGTWFRDYVYIPLGGNRTSKLRHIFNIVVVWALTGIWHGANWTFMAWGLYFAVFLIIEKFFLGRVLEKIPAVLSHIYCILLTTISWVIFNSPSLAYALKYIGRMFDFSATSERFLYLVSQNALCIIVCIIAALPFSKHLPKLFKNVKNNSLRIFITEYPAGIFAAILFCLSILYLINSTFNAFIYFRF